MRLTEEQKNKVRALFGEDVAKADAVLEKIASVKGRMKLFKEDGEVALSADELEQKLAGKEEKAGEAPKVTKETSFQKIQRNLKEIKGSVRGLKYDECAKVLEDLEALQESVKKRKITQANKKLEEIDRMRAEVVAIMGEQQA